MMSTKFLEVLVLRSATKRTLAWPLTPVQLAFLAALGVSASVFTQPPAVGGSP